GDAHDLFGAVAVLRGDEEGVPRLVDAVTQGRALEPASLPIVDAYTLRDGHKALQHLWIDTTRTPVSLTALVRSTSWHVLGRVRRITKAFAIAYQLFTFRARSPKD